jgi:penicillin-binding protein 2
VELWRTTYYHKVDNVQQTLDALRTVVDLDDDDIAAFKKERSRV